MNNEKKESADKIVGSTDGLGGFCGSCEHWEPYMGQRRYRPEQSGYCPLFDKAVNAAHGEQCTAYAPPNAAHEPTATNKQGE